MLRPQEDMLSELRPSPHAKSDVNGMRAIEVALVRRRTMTCTTAACIEMRRVSS